MFRVLVVDDEASIRAELQESLQEAGFETAGAGDGASQHAVTLP